MENTREQKLQSQFRKIKVFQIIQKNLASVGIGPNSSLELRQFNAKILLISLIYALAIMSHILYISKDAETFAEYTQCTYMCCTMTLTAAIWIIIIVQLEEFFKVIHDCECLVNTSKKTSNFNYVSY